MSRRFIAIFAGATITLAGCSGKDAGTDTAAADTAAAATPAATDTAATGTGTVGAGVVVPASAAAGVTATSGALVDPNTASREQIAAVPGMTAQAAEALVGGRPYADMRAVDQVLARSIADTTTRNQVYAQLWKRIDLNKATPEEIMLIPGVGRRMAREFDEYRPYTDMARFRREMGKYVDEAEVARHERYVEIR